MSNCIEGVLPGLSCTDLHQVYPTVCVVCDWLGLSYLCLDHERPVHTHVIGDAKHIRYAFTLDLEDDAINGDEGSCTTHALLRLSATILCCILTTRRCFICGLLVATLLGSTAWFHCLTVTAWLIQRSYPTN